MHFPFDAVFENIVARKILFGNSRKLLIEQNDEAKILPMKYLLTLVLLFSAIPSQGKNLKTFEGKFKKIQSGDYIHLHLVSDKGEKISFICEDLPKNLVKGVDCSEIESKHRNKMLKVTYYEKKNFIPEANDRITWNYIDKIELK